jgi:hypothetical protein
MATFTDDFNRADSSNLGANWVEVSGDWSIISNQLSSGNAGGTIILRAAGAMSTNDHSAQVTIASTAAVSHGVWCRGNSNISQGYLWRNDGTSWNLFSVVGASFVSIGSFAGAAVAGDVPKIQAVGTTIKGFVNGIQRVSVTDTNVATGTSVGIRAESTNALRFDDFTAADVTTGTTGDATLAGTATLTATGLRATTGSSALAATATLSATVLRATAGTAALASTASVTADGTRATSGTSSLPTTAALTANGTRGTQTDTGLTATAALATQGQVTYSGTTALTATATLTADGTTGTPPGGAALSAAAILTAAGTTAVISSAALAATATLTASGNTISTTDDINVTVGAPYSLWTVGQPYGDDTSATVDTPRGLWTVGQPNVPAWNAQGPQVSSWKVEAPC